MPDKAGGWYPAGAAALAAEVDACVRRARNDYGGALAAASGVPAAIMVPHAGLSFSGTVAAAGFQLVRERLDRVDAFVVFGACHRCRLGEPAIWPDGAWRTPLGDIEIAADLAGALVAGGCGSINPGVHAGDNAIELQTPFIKRLFPEAKMLPVAMSDFHDAWRLGALAAGLAAGRGGTVVAVASCDLTHYGESFGVMPAGRGEAALDWIRANDERFIQTLVDMRSGEIVPVARRDGSACGAGAAAAAAGWAKALGCDSGRLLAHSNSHAAMPRGVAEHVVGYAAIAFSLR